MIILHAFWEIDSGLHLWAESSAKLPIAPRRGKERVKKVFHPFDLPHDSLKKFVADLSSNFPFSETKSGNLTVLLPSTENAPVPSEECLLSGESEIIVLLEKNPWTFSRYRLSKRRKGNTKRNTKHWSTRDDTIHWCPIGHTIQWYTNNNFPICW